MAVEVRVSVHCEHPGRDPARSCHRRLLDAVNEIEAGQIVLEIKCPACGGLTRVAVGPYKRAVG